jgi:hypothetical protein
MTEPADQGPAGLRPILFLDVDGVLNCQHVEHHPVLTALPRLPADPRRQQDLMEEYGAEDPAEFDGMTRERAAHVPVGTRERLAKILPFFEPVWATFWFSDAHPVLEAHLGLPEEPWPYLAFLGDWKLPAIIEYAAGRPWAWVDDDATFEQRRNPDVVIPANALIVQPHVFIGLTDAHVDELLAFSAAISTADRA